MLDRNRTGPGFRAQIPLYLKEGILSVAAAATGAAGSMSAADKTKLDAITTALTTDANGWQVNYEPTGKRLWRKQWLAVSLTANPDIIAVNAASLPVGVSTQAAVHLESVTSRVSGSGGRVHVGVEGTESSTTLTIIASTTDATNLSTKASTIDIFVTLAER